MDHVRGCYTGNVIAVTLLLLVGLAGAVMARVPLATCPACRGTEFHAVWWNSPVDRDNSDSAYGGPNALRCQRCYRGRAPFFARVTWKSQSLDRYQYCEHPGHIPWETPHFPYIELPKPKRLAMHQ